MNEDKYHELQEKMVSAFQSEAGAANNRSDEIAWLESTIAFCKQRFNDRYISIIIDRLNDRIAQLRVVR